MAPAPRGLNIGFLDRIGWDYTPDTPYQRSLGGSQSALCYLAEALAARGHRVFLFNHGAASGMSRGVACLSLAREPGELIQAMIREIDVLVVLNNAGAAEMLRPLRQAGGPRCVLWSGHDVTQPGVSDLAHPDNAAFWDGFALVSQWQAERYVARFHLPVSRVFLARNAVSPCFQGLFAPGEAMAPHKAEPPVVVYASPPDRGLELLLEAFPRLRAAVPGVRLLVFSDFAVYRVARADDPFVPLYERCAATEGVEFRGSVSQTELALAMKGASCLTYPCTVQETSCIAVMEAMAAGCVVIATPMGALPETCGEFGFLCPLGEDADAFVARYVTLASTVLHRFAQRPQVAEAYRQRQVRAMLDTHVWSHRAGEWEAWCGRLMTSSSTTGVH